MKQIDKLKMMALMAMGILSFTITGCSSDEFYGFEEQHEEYKYNYIIYSQEYSDYVSSLNCFASFMTNQLDSNYCENNFNKNIMQEYTCYYSKLVKVFPEYATIPIIDKIEILNHYNIDSSSKIIRTKSGSPEGSQMTTAWKSLNLPRPNTITKVDDSNYICESVTLTIYDDPTTAITYAIVFAMGNPYDSDDNHEVGGYVFNDSSILMCDVSSSANSMNLVHWPFGNNAPQYVFHVHPVFTALSNQLDAADAATKAVISADGCPIFRIYNLYSEYKDY